MKPYYDHAGITIYHGDCLEVLPSLAGVDLVLTDPPYNLSLASAGKMTGWGDLMNGAFFYAHLLKEFERLTANRQGAAWVFNSWRGLPVLMKAAFEADWPIVSLLVWDKEWIGPGGQRGLRPSYELVALFCQSTFAITNRGLPDIWRCPFSSHKPNGHPAEKPVALVSRTVQESGGDSVLDPFMGSGTTLVAAQALGKQCVGIEIEPRYCEIAVTRLRNEVLI